VLHIADHVLGTAWNALKAVKEAGNSVEEERKGKTSSCRPKLKNWSKQRWQTKNSKLNKKASKQDMG